MYNEAAKYLKRMFGEGAEFRTGQWEAIDLALHNKKALIVQQTGWGKSIVYFIATKILRSAGKGPTILISPLLSLVRNQIDSASKLGIVAESINSQNVDEWDSVDDPYAKECGKCSICMGEKFFSTDINEKLALKAIKFLKGEHIEIERRKQWPAGIITETQKKISLDEQVQDGLLRVLL